MNDLTDVKVGDLLCVKRSLNSDQLTAVTRITPSGRIITKYGQFNPDGFLRGETGYFRAFATPATEDDIARIRRLNLVAELERFRKWHKLTADDLKSAVAIIERYKDSP